MEKPKHHIFVCSSSRVNGEPKGVCSRKEASQLIQYLESELNDRGMEEVMVTNTGCMKLCDHGPVMVIYPEGYWYGNVNEEAIDQILDALEEGKAATDLLLM
ncbi:(2Fe-2S) ferredoxin [Hydrogenispora ethanolica]|uniref:(2Fe-2S) ferredoxin n=1 Tax=Hydrogenispora ethanolica TaxID=1082276 RepID=A0A4R1RE85_HYDET|nr:(2Fe-2S) ferredoxin domain-containing protein [Hydrogenispora ethanolica]TCL64224.1 (2Fe-2S) ferredoxin [Hydrogenispora ethanolica]